MSAPVGTSSAAHGPPSKRKVTTRSRSGCATCRARRLKCGEEKPHCRNCARASLPCGGYAPRIKFKDQTQLLKQKHNTANAQTVSPHRPSSYVAESALITRSRVAQVTDWTARSPLHTPLPAVPANTVVSPTPVEVRQATSKPTLVADHDEETTAEHHRERGIDDVALAIPTDLPYQQTTSTGDADTPSCSSFDSNRDLHSPPPEHTFSHTADSFHHSDEVQIPAGRVNLENPEHMVNIQRSRPELYRAHPAIQSSFAGSVPQPSASDKRFGAPSIAPSDLRTAAKFTEDVVYYHHLCDASQYGLISIMDLKEVLYIDCLDEAFFHAALALSALDISQSCVADNILKQVAPVHALEHFITALGMASTATLDEEDQNLVECHPPSRDNDDGHMTEQRIVVWLATLLLLAHFELQRGQLKLWHMHSRAAVISLSKYIDSIAKSAAGQSVIRSFSRITVLLDIFDRSYTIHNGLAAPHMSESLNQFLSLASNPTDRLLVLLPHVIEFEEEYRSSPDHDHLWSQKAESLIGQLTEWRRSLSSADVPPMEELEADPWERGSDGHAHATALRPLILDQATAPVQAATNFMHYLLSLTRLGTRYLPGAGRELPHNVENVVVAVCRLAAGVSPAACAATNVYGHGMAPALLNAYYLSEDCAIRTWIKQWIAQFPRDREGIWNVRHAYRLLQYVDGEYGQRGSRANWEIIKVRMVDLESESPSQDDPGQDGDRFTVEIYSRCKRGWSIDFVDVP